MKLLTVRRNIILLMLLFLACGCATFGSGAKNELQFNHYTASRYQPRPNNYPIEFFYGAPPDRPYEVIGELNGTVEEELMLTLENRARQVGGDALIDIDIATQTEEMPPVERPHSLIYQIDQLGQIEPGYSYKVSNVKAKVIRYKN